VTKNENNSNSGTPGPTKGPLPAGHIIDLRSDTVTRPTPPMIEAMAQARVGDDVYGEDETVNALQAKIADLFGMEAALFCPSGTMTNQIAIRAHTRPGDEVICDQFAHIYMAEGGGIAVISGASVRLLNGENGRFTATQVLDSINPSDDSHFPRTRLVAIENTVNRGGGCCWDLAEIRRIREACDRNDLSLHMDGARIFNAIVARGESPRQYGELFDSISVCLSKGLGAPVGSLLLGKKEWIRSAHRLRKVFGGGMRQAGHLAAAGIYALDHNVVRLKSDHEKARVVERELHSLRGMSTVLPAETNIVIFKLEPSVNAESLLTNLRSRDILAQKIAPQTIRMVFHMDITDADTEVISSAIRAFAP
jgi:threonine aldolase